MLFFRHMGFRKRLLDHLRKKHIDRELREKRLTTTYSHMVQEWLKKVEKVRKDWLLFIYRFLDTTVLALPLQLMTVEDCFVGIEKSIFCWCCLAAKEG